MVECGPEIVGSVSGKFGKAIGSLLSQSHLADEMLRFIRVRLSKSCAQVLLLKESRDLPFEFGEITFSPCEFTA